MGRCMLLFAIRFLWGAPYRLGPGARKATLRSHIGSERETDKNIEASGYAQ
jgi:hypothetical protein